MTIQQNALDKTLQALYAKATDKRTAQRCRLQLEIIILLLLAFRHQDTATATLLAPMQELYQNPQRFLQTGTAEAKRLGYSPEEVAAWELALAAWEHATQNSRFTRLNA